MEDIRQQSATAAMNAAVTKFTEEPEPHVPGKDFDDWDFTFNGYAGTLDPSYPALLKAARQSTTVVTATPHHDGSPRQCCICSRCSHRKGARKVVRKVGNNGFEAYRQLCMMYGVSDHEGSAGLFVQIMTYKFGSRIQDVDNRLNEFLELVRRYDEERYRSRSRSIEKGLCHFEHARTAEDTSSVECQQP